MLATSGSMTDLMAKQQFHFLKILMYSVKVYCNLSKPISQFSSHECFVTAFFGNKVRFFIESFLPKGKFSPVFDRHAQSLGIL